MIASTRNGETGGVHLERLGLDVLRVAAIYGANAAGKSNVLAALSFMCKAVAQSHRSWKPEGPVPREPFLLDPAARAVPSMFEAEFLVEGVRFRYGFEVDDERVLREWLYAYPHKRQQLWFQRDAEASEAFEFGKHLRGSNRIIAELTRKNSLFLSAAAENNHEALLPIYSWFSRRVQFAGVENRGARARHTMKLFQRDELRPSLLDLIRHADLGISDFSLREEPLDRLMADLLKVPLETFDPELSKPEFKVPKIELFHKGAAGSITLPFEQESAGTRAWFALAGPLLETLLDGELLCVDELDASLHPRLAFEVIQIFKDPARNPRNAQLIFNTHDATLLGNLLGEPALRRDQVWFAEKDEAGATHLYPLTEFKPRKAENLARGYLQGRYGAVPFIEPPAAVVDDA